MTVSLPETPKPAGRMVYDVRAGRMRLADATGALPELATPEAMVPLINRLLAALGVEPLPESVTADSLMPVLADVVKHVEELHATEDVEDVTAAAMVNELRVLCGLPRATLTARLSEALREPLKVVQSVPAVAARGKLLSANPAKVRWC